jgi:hypothetical protein
LDLQTQETAPKFGGDFEGDLLLFSFPDLCSGQEALVKKHIQGEGLGPRARGLKCQDDLSGSVLDKNFGFFGEKVGGFFGSRVQALKPPVPIALQFIQGRRKGGKNLEGFPLRSGRGEAFSA